MKHLKRSARLIVGCVFALSLITNVPAQAQVLPSATYYSAKDLDLPGLPYNPYPNAPVWEVEAGHFVVDDTGIPDTVEQAAVRQQRQATIQRANEIANDAAASRAAKEAHQAVQQAAWQRNQEAISPWLHHDMRGSDGRPATLNDRLLAESLHLITLQQKLAAKAIRDRAAVEEYCAVHGISSRTVGPDGSIEVIAEIENGSPRILRTCNAYAADTIGTDELWPNGNTGLNLAGTNLTIGLWDGGDAREHEDLGFWGPTAPRLTNMDGPSQLGWSYHATHVAGTLAATGLNPLVKGMAYQARLLAWDFVDDAAEMAAAVVTHNLRISNHSYNRKTGWDSHGSDSYWFGDIAVNANEDYHFGYYSARAQTIDELAHSAPTYLPIWAAANERGSYGKPIAPPGLGYWTTSNEIPIFSYDSRPDDGDPGGFDTLPEYAVAKNVLAVGAVEPITNGYVSSIGVVMSDFSSFGPTDDGRIKPDVVADGVNVLSLADGNSGYILRSGTSMATPSVCGSLGLVLELHDRLYGTNHPMLASTLKGLAIHTADEAGAFPGPDYRFGWGLFNARKAALLVTNSYASGSLAHIKEVRLTGGDHVEFPVASDGAQPLIATIQWNDPPGTPPAVSVDPTNLMLVNDLDLRIITPSGATNLPWVLDPVARTNAATLGDNFRDNVEQVVITNTTAGTYLIRITHKGANLVTGISGATNEQWVSILISGNTPQTAPPLQITSITVISSNSIALTWPSVVGRVYAVQHRDDVASSSWSNSSGEISATKTNLAIELAMPGGVANRFYRVEQLR